MKTGAYVPYILRLRTKNIMLNKNMTSHTFPALILAFSLSISIAIAQNAAFKTGQKVTFDDRQGTYGGGRITATVTKDRGPSWEYAGRYEVRVDGAEPKWQDRSFNASELQPAEQSPGRPAATGADAAAGVNHPNAAFKVGEKVNFDDRLMRYGGGRITATVIKDKGPSWEYAGRYQVRIDGAPAGQEIQDFNASDLQKGGAGAQPPQPVAQAPAAQQPQGAPAHPANPQPANPGHNPPARPAPAPGAVHAANDWGRPPARGSFKYGKPNLRPMLGHNAITPPGLKEFFVGTPPGDESPVGRWYTRTGGVWTKKGGPDYDGNQTYEWGNPEVAELINVMPNGTWAMNDHGKVTTGKWYDIGQNVIRLVNMTPGQDWTASVYDHMIQFKGEIGLTKEGNRY